MTHRAQKKLENGRYLLNDERLRKNRCEAYGHVNPSYHLLRNRPNPGLLSIVIPCFNEAEAIPHLRSRLEKSLPSLGIPVELVLVNDGGSDETLDLLLQWAAADPQVKVLGLARNFGHQAAITAGLDHCRGDAAVILDADLQDPPEVIEQMLAEYRRGYDVVYGQRTDRKGETRFKQFSAWAFYRLMGAFIQQDLPPDTGDFRLVSRACLDALLTMRETHRFMRGMVAWMGFPQTAVKYSRQARVAGQTKYPLRKMLRFAWTAAVSFSPAPIRVSFFLGFIMSAVGMSYGVYALMSWFLGLYIVPGWTSLIVLICLIGGALQISIGIIGEYVARVFEEMKGRPLYIVSMASNVEARPVGLAPLTRPETERAGCAPTGGRGSESKP